MKWLASLAVAMAAVRFAPVGNLSAQASAALGSSLLQAAAMAAMAVSRATLGGNLAAAAVAAAGSVLAQLENIVPYN